MSRNHNLNSPLPNQEKFAAIILAGGKGRRLGQDKTQLTIKGENILKKIFYQLSSIDFYEFIIVFGDTLRSSGLPAREVTDLIPNRGSLGGIHSGIYHSRCQSNFVIACDLPFPNLDLIKYLLAKAQSGEYDCIVPCINNRFEPLFAVYKKTCLPIIETKLNQNRFKISEIFSSLNTLTIHENEINQFDPQHLSFFNINTKEDLKKAETFPDGS